MKKNLMKELSLQVMRDRTWERHHWQLTDLPSFGASCNFVGQIFFVKGMVTYVTKN